MSILHQDHSVLLANIVRTVVPIPATEVGVSHAELGLLELPDSLLAILVAVTVKGRALCGSLDGF